MGEDMTQVLIWESDIEERPVAFSFLQARRFAKVEKVDFLREGRVERDRAGVSVQSKALYLATDMSPVAALEEAERMLVPLQTR